MDEKNNEKGEIEVQQQPVIAPVLVIEGARRSRLRVALITFLLCCLVTTFPFCAQDSWVPMSASELSNHLEIVHTCAAGSGLIVVKNDDAAPRIEATGCASMHEPRGRVELDSSKGFVTVYVPTSAFLSIHSQSEIRIDAAFEGNVRGGSIVSDSYYGNAHFTTNYGSISGRYTMNHRLHFTTNSGAIDVTVGFGSVNGSAELTTQSNSGSTSARVESAGYRDISASHQAHSGSVSAYYPEAFQGSVFTETMSGSIDLVGAEIVHERRTPSGGSIVGKHGDGPGSITARASSGSVTCVISG